MWDDFIQEEIRRESLHGGQQRGEEEENLAFTEKGKGKAKKKKPNEGETSQDKKKKDVSKVKCFTCHKSGHFASQCHYKKKGKGKHQVATSVEIDEFADKFEKQFSWHPSKPTDLFWEWRCGSR